MCTEKNLEIVYWHEIIIKEGSSRQTFKPHLPFSLMITSFNPVIHSSMLDLVLGVKSTTQQLFLNIFTALVYSLLHCSTVCIGCSHDLKISSSCRKIINNVQDFRQKLNCRANHITSPLLIRKEIP